MSSAASCPQDVVATGDLHPPKFTVTDASQPAKIVAILVGSVEIQRALSEHAQLWDSNLLR